METAVLLPSQSIIKKNSKFTDLLSSLFMKVKEKYFWFSSYNILIKPYMSFFCYKNKIKSNDNMFYVYSRTDNRLAVISTWQ